MKGLLYINKEGKPEFSEYALSLEPLAKLWRRDKSENKWMAYKELSFIILITDMGANNPYREYSKEERKTKLMKDIFDNNYNLGDEDFRAAVIFVKERSRSMAKEHLSNAIEALDNISRYLKSVNLSDVGVDGKPIHNVKQFQEVAQRTAKDVQNLLDLKRIVDNEDKVKSTIRAGGEEELSFE